MSDTGEWAERARKAQEAVNEPGAGPPGLTDADREFIRWARELGPALRASTGDRDRLAGWLLAELVAIIERLTETAIAEPVTFSRGLYQCPCCYGPSVGPGWCDPCLALGMGHAHSSPEPDP